MIFTSPTRRFAGRLRVPLYVLCGALLAVTVLGSVACSGSTSPTQSTTYTGSFTGEESLSSGTSGVASCVFRMAHNGTMRFTLEQRQDGTVAGTAETTGTKSLIARVQGSAANCFDYTSTPITWSLPVTGTPANLAFSGRTVDTQNGTSTITFTFSGALANGVITGTATYTELTQGVQSGTGLPTFSSGSVTLPVTLR